MPVSGKRTSAHELLRSVARGDPSALRAFGGRYGSLAVALTRRAFPDAPGAALRELAHRALQACVDELPRLGGALFRRDWSAEAWVGAVCGRVLHEAAAERQLEATGRRASGLLPEALPESRHFRLKAYYRPAAVLSGDYYDAVARADGSLVVLIADVMGHGAPAALLVPAVKLAFRTGARTGGAAAVLGAMNRALQNVFPPSCFAEAGVLRLGPGRGQCEFAGAGMGGAFVVSPAEDAPRCLGRPGHLLGLLDEASYEPVRLHLAAGDHVLVCTDGVRDLHNDAGEAFGQERLQRILRRAAREGGDLHGDLAGALAAFGGGAGWCDDVCFVTATAG